MKSFIFKAFAIMTAMMMSLTFASCGDDNDDPEIPTKKSSTLIVDYSLSLSQDYFDLWDIQVTYTGAGGQPVTETVNADWSNQLKLNTSDEIPTQYKFSVIAKPKAQAPVLDPDKKYTLNSEYFVQIKQISADGETLSEAGMLIPKTDRKTTGGDHLTSAITKDRSICDVKYDINIK